MNIYEGKIIDIRKYEKFKDNIKVSEKESKRLKKLRKSRLTFIVKDIKNPNSDETTIYVDRPLTKEEDKRLNDSIKVIIEHLKLSNFDKTEILKTIYHIFCGVDLMGLANNNTTYEYITEILEKYFEISIKFK